MHLCSPETITALTHLLSKYGMCVAAVEPEHAIPGSHWGDSEAGLVGNTVYVRADTPLHSALHEACHFICMDSQRRSVLHTDAGGTDLEENAVCYLQMLLAEQLRLPEVSISSQQKDMDQWGYSFRLGSSKAWFENDADDAREWLIQNGLISPELHPLFCVRA